MRPISEVATQQLLWVQPAARKKAHELRAGDEVVATLVFQGASLADAVAADQHWTFKRQGFWNPRVTARVAGTDAEVAVFRPRWMGGGSLDSPKGKTIDLSAANLWHTRWVWKEGDSTPVLFKAHQGFIKSGAEVEITPDAVKRSDLPLLVLLGYYLILLYAQDSAAAAATAATTVATTSG